MLSCYYVSVFYICSRIYFIKYYLSATCGRLTLATVLVNVFGVRRAFNYGIVL